MVSRKRLTAVASAYIIALPAAACDGTTAPQSQPAVDDASTSVGACSRVATRCHPYYSERPTTHECHDLGFAGDDVACAAREGECLGLCPELVPTDAGPPSSDAASSDAGDSSACAVYCACLASTCATIDSYPYAAAGSCMSACAALPVKEQACYGSFCEGAKTAMNRASACSVAWGNGAHCSAH